MKRELLPHEILLKPIVSEKSYEASEHSKYHFMVHPDANKVQVRKAVEAIFKKKVAKVNMYWVKGKRKRLGRSEGKRPDWKRAVVTLEGNEHLEFFEKM